MSHPIAVPLTETQADATVTSLLAAAAGPIETGRRFGSAPTRGRVENLQPERCG